MIGSGRWVQCTFWSQLIADVLNQLLDVTRVPTDQLQPVSDFAALVIQPPLGIFSDRMRSPIGRRLPFIVVGAPVAAGVFGLIPHAQVLPLFIFILIGFLSALASLLIIESITLFPNNHEMTTNVEFTVLVHQFYGRKFYYAFLFILYGSLQSTNIASIVGSAQIFDTVIVGLFGATCGYGIYPKTGLYCVYSVTNSNSPFGDNFMFTTLGYLVIKY